MRVTDPTLPHRASALANVGLNETYLQDERAFRLTCSQCYLYHLAIYQKAVEEGTAPKTCIDVSDAAKVEQCTASAKTKDESALSVVNSAASCWASTSQQSCKGTSVYPFTPMDIWPWECGATPDLAVNLPGLFPDLDLGAFPGLEGMALVELPPPSPPPLMPGEEEAQIITDEVELRRPAPSSTWSRAAPRTPTART